MLGVSNWYLLEILKPLDTDATIGLSHEAVNRRRRHLGANVLARAIAQKFLGDAVRAMNYQGRCYFL
ncbi:MAG: hypothetical protein DSM106950_34565 [Stigonema ocellatum SAG 48.90 = DSM 106950]|nr:hypothetical protein [Stigonema ocellatum SAG 48.90 = DSM 106950]